MRGHRPSLVLALTGWVVLGNGAAAQVPELGEGADALPGVIHLGAPLPPARIGVAVDLGYAGTDALADGDGFHHRGDATLAAAVSPLRGLSVSLRADGRIDRHPDDGGGAYSEKATDLRLKLRIGDRVSTPAFMALELGGIMPGVDGLAPQPSAIGLEARWLTAFALSARSAFVGNMGFALRRNDEALDDTSMLRPGQRLSYGIGPGEVLLLGVGTSIGVASRLELLLEASADLFVGTGAAQLKRSPMRVSAGARYHVGDAVQLGASVDLGLSKRGDLEPRTPLAPVQPMLAARASLRIALDRHPAREIDAPAPREEPEPVVEAPPEPEPPPATAAQAVSAVTEPEPAEPPPAEEPPVTEPPDAEAAAPVDAEPDAQGPEEAPPEGDESEEGAGSEEGPPPGLGQIRGHVRSFAGEGLKATASFYPSKTKATTDDSGYFQVDVHPGRYIVRIRSYGYRSQNRTVVVGEDGVTVLNVELRKK